MSHTPDEMNMLSDEYRVVTVKDLTSWRDRALNLEKKRDELQQQRDTLLEASKNIRQFVVDDCIPEEFWTDEFKNAIKSFDYAIASIESPTQEQ